MAIIPETATTIIADSESQGRNLRKRMWPSFETAVWLYDKANIFLIGALVAGAIATGLSIWMGNVKEGYLNRKAEEERLARIKIEEKLAPRVLNQSQQSNLQSGLASFKGTALDIFIYGGGSEDALPLAGMIASSLSAIGWNVRVWNTISPGRWYRGIAVSFRAGSGSKIESVAVRLIAALNAQGLVSGSWEPFTTTEIPDALTGPNWEPDKVAPIRMMIGSKP